MNHLTEAALKSILDLADKIELDVAHHQKVTHLRHVPSPTMFKLKKKFRKRLDALNDDALLELYVITCVGRDARKADYRAMYTRFFEREKKLFDKEEKIIALLSLSNLAEHIRQGLHKIWHNESSEY